MDCVVREGFPEEVALRRALKVGKREPHGRSEVSGREELPRARVPAWG